VKLSFPSPVPSSSPSSSVHNESGNKEAHSAKVWLKPGWGRDGRGKGAGAAGEIELPSENIRDAHRIFFRCSEKELALLDRTSETGGNRA